MSELNPVKQAPGESITTSAGAEHVEIHPWGTGDSPSMPTIDSERHLVNFTALWPFWL
jgi:hypothetical protein